MKITLLSISILVFFLFGICEAKDLKGKKPAQKPPLGWNSFDCYGVYLHHEAAIKNIEAFAEKLKPHGYEYFVIDAGWYGEFKLKNGTKYPKEIHAEKIKFDEFGIVQPSNCYFPHGLKILSEKCHTLGIKFGLHMMRGIPREVVHLNLPIKGTKYRASDISDTTSICTWNSQFYGVDMSKPGAQEYYNSVIDQFAAWGVDFIKYDDIVPYPKEIEGIANAISQSGRNMVLSLSPGGKVDENNIEFFKLANMLRVTKDIWDEQIGIDEAFKAWRKWQGKADKGFWIDLDMIPFGELLVMSPMPKVLTGKETQNEIKERKRNGELENVYLLSGKGWHRWSQFTKPQMLTFITMRALSASPLMVGSELTSIDDFSLKLLTNAEMLSCNQNGVMGHLVHDNDDIEIWQTPEKNSNNGWIGVFNRSSKVTQIKLDEKLLGFKTDNYMFFDVWNEKEIAISQQQSIQPNGVIFLKYIN